MSEPCVNDTDLYFIEDFTDPLNLAKLRRRKKMVVIYRNTKNPKRLNEYKKNCFLRDQLLKALNLEATQQITTWGDMSYDRRVKKLGLIPPADPDIFKTEYISDRSIRFLNLYDTFEIIECGSYKVGSESSGVSSIHGSEEIVCRLSPIVPIENKEEKAELKKLKNATSFDNLYNVIPEYNKKYTNINNKIWRRIITVVENYSPSGRRDIPSGTYYGRVKEGPGPAKANGYGELVIGDAVIGGRADDTVKERTEIIGVWSNGVPIQFYKISRRYNKYNIDIEIHDEEDNNKLIYKVEFEVDFGRMIDDAGIIKPATTSVYNYTIKFTNVLNNKSDVFSRNFPIMKHSAFEGAPTAFLQEYYAKLALFINIVDYEFDDDLAQNIIFLLSLENFNFNDILNMISLMATQYNLDILKSQFNNQFVKDILSRYINITDNEYIRKINNVTAVGTLVPLISRPVARSLFDDFNEAKEDELPPISPMLQRDEDNIDDMEPLNEEKVEEYFEDIWYTIDSNNLIGFNNILYDNMIPRNYITPVLNYNQSYNHTPILYKAFEFAIVSDNLEFLNGIFNFDFDTYIKYQTRNGGRYYNPITYFFDNNDYINMDSERIKNVIYQFFYHLENDVVNYIDETSIIPDLEDMNVDEEFISYIQGLRDRFEDEAYMEGNEDDFLDDDIIEGY